MLDLLAYETLPPKEEVLRSVNQFIERCAKFYYLHGEKDLLLDTEELFRVIETAVKFLVNYKEFSGFKAAGIFTLLMASKKPINSPLPKQFGLLRTEPNTVLAGLESLYWLHGADLLTQEGTKKIKNPIQFSDHFLIELVQAASFACQNFQGSYTGADDKSKSCLTALVFEAVAYQTNGDIPYKNPANNPLVEKAKLYFVAGKGIKVV